MCNAGISVFQPSPEAQELSEHVRFYCVKCRSAKDVLRQEVRVLEHENGRLIWQAKCPGCRIEMFRLAEGDTLEGTPFATISSAIDRLDREATFLRD